MLRIYLLNISNTHYVYFRNGEKGKQKYKKELTKKINVRKNILSDPPSPQRCKMITKKTLKNKNLKFTKQNRQVKEETLQIELNIISHKTIRITMQLKPQNAIKYLLFCSIKNKLSLSQTILSKQNCQEILIQNVHMIELII
ncbi:unnamed protein product (macronuclear) [Paramecium tetraurelia]|uniref:Uncharacterized protein n=1 Tax=Paramecium tetraurelia TaxID=5888 RepID=A0DPT8_PARTE|nr:uncharacterized protein GSPATT00019237001 [Paramecium tetraurelia]CAK85055.1 unnamed protein product [Paramecium tetraurelia]|eukprot:XP_001452452.1 hypothetical protein (macronuclear) [Paramecium tetraurelia strain d4-2]